MLTWHGVPPTHLALDRLQAAGVRHGFTTRHHGSLAGPGAPAGPFGAGGPLLSSLDVAAPAVRFVRQVHGVDCVVADHGPPGLLGSGDAILTGVRRRPLAIFTADCLAVVLCDPDRGALGMAHAGWRGTVAGILPALVRALVEHVGARPEALLAGIGPSIGPCCYEVDEPVVARLRAAFPADWARWARPGRPGRWWLDLWQANADQLVAAGVRAEAVLNPRLCTSCRRELFFSYRRDGSGLRSAAVAVLA